MCVKILNSNGCDIMTRREEIIEFLKTTEATIKELGLKYSVPSTVIVDDLEHIFKTLRSQTDTQLLIKPAKCLNDKCGFIFSASRKRMSDPSKCPECHGERIISQEFKVEND